MRNSLFDLGNSHVYSRHFSPNFHIYWFFFWNSANFLLFMCIRPYIWHPEHPNFFTQKKLWGPPYWVGEPSCILTSFSTPIFSKKFEDIHIELGNYLLYSNHFYHPISAFTGLFLWIVQISLFFVCISL